MKQSSIAVVVVISLAISVSTSTAGEVRAETRTINMEDARRLDISCDFGAGEIRIRPADISEAAKLEVEYSPRYVSFDSDYRVRGKTGHLVLESDVKHKYPGDLENNWDLQLSDRYPIEMKLEIGACEADIDLGGLPLTSLALEVGAASGDVDFSRLNPQRLRDLEIKAGASSLEVHNLGNANFERMHFAGGAASCDLDFRGEIKGESEVHVEVGIGSLDITVPRHIAVRVETEDASWFSSVDFHGLELEEVEDGVFETEDYSTADNRITFTVEVGMGSVDFYSRR